MSSLKMTFSLTSLILIFALGLVFVPTSVLAEDPTSGLAARSHGHPLSANLLDDPNTPATEPTVNAHNAHPMVTSITLKGDNTKGSEAKVSGTTAGTTDTFTLVVTFDRALAAANNLRAIDSTASPLADSEIENLLLNKDRITAATDGTTPATLTFGTIERVADSMGKQLEVPVTIGGSYPSGTKADGHEVMYLRVRINAAAGFSLQVVPDGAADVVNGGASLRSMGYEFKLVKDFTPAPVSDPAAVTFAVSGTPSLTAPFTATFTSTSMDADGDLKGAMFVIDDVMVTGGYPVEASLNSNSSPANAPMTVWTVIIQPYPGTTNISVTIRDNSKTAPAADEDDGMLKIAGITLSSLTAAEGANDEAMFVVTLTFSQSVTSLMADDLMVTPAAAIVGTPAAVLGSDNKMWQVEITPVKGMATTVALAEDSDYGMGSVAKLTVKTKAAQATDSAAPTAGTIEATHDATKGEVALKGLIAANGFATIGAADLPNLEEFFVIGGTIGVDDGDGADDKNARSVVISEILWGLDFGERTVTMQDKHQFIELYNTTNAAIDLMGWKLVFTEGRPVPNSDIDQVSNRAGAGWDVNIGQSGRVTNTTADGKGTSAPINIVSMYRKINYDKVEKVKADGSADPNRDEQLKGIPGGNGSGSWAASIRASASGILSTPNSKHFTTTAVLTASGVAGTPFRINEIGNDTGSDNDWVELHNVTDSEQSLKNYQLTAVTAKGTDTELFDFKDQDWKVPAKGFVVISTRHPRDTDLAAGKDLAIADDQEANAGASHLFVVKSVNLPDNGKFALILRNAHDKEKSNGNLIDVVATRQGAFADNTIGTSVWPLNATGQPHENVIDGGDENFAAGKVYQRNKDNGRGEKHFAVRGYTGVGYDRAAAATSANGGTPGYENGAVKEKVADLSSGAITISEIMVDTGEGRQSLAQWIELYNSSMTQAVNLNGWKLVIENASDVSTALNATLSLDGMTISPNQTVLIASSSGRVSDPDHFPSSRVVNLWTTKKHRDELEMTRRTDQVFSSTGFHFELIDKDNKSVDKAGNLDGNRRTRDEPSWALSAGEEDGRRSSLIRVYDEGVAVSGITAAGWVSADTTNLAFAISQTYYGAPDDFGTPGFRGGGPLPVSLSKFRPERLKDTGEIVVRWVTQSELNNAGFNILRSEKRDGEFTKVHFEAGQGTTSERNTYEWRDTSAKPNVVYYYQIQDVSLDGGVTTLRTTHLRGNVTATGKLTTTWGEIKALQ